MAQAFRKQTPVMLVRMLGVFLNRSCLPQAENRPISHVARLLQKPLGSVANSVYDICLPTGDFRLDGVAGVTPIPTVICHQ